MDFLGIGPLELFFILIIALIIFGPNDIVRAGKTIGSFLRKVVTSDGWRTFQQASKGMRDLPNTLMREAGLEEEELRKMTGIQDLEQTTKDFENQISPWTTPPTKKAAQLEKPEGDPTSEDISQPQEESVAPPSPPPGSPFSQNIDKN